MRKSFRNTDLIKLFVGVLILVIFAGWHYAGTASPAAASEEVIKQGQQVYADQCASCHGVELEGHPDWRSPLPSGRLPAPPHDESGHTWYHPDDILFRIVKEGTAAIVGAGYESDMPGFGDVLSDAEEHLAGARAELPRERVTGKLDHAG